MATARTSRRIRPTSSRSDPGRSSSPNTSKANTTRSRSSTNSSSPVGPKLDKIVVRAGVRPECGGGFDRSAVTSTCCRLSPTSATSSVCEKMPNPSRSTDKGFAGIGPINWLAFNTKKKPLDDVRVRQAIAYAANRDFIISKLMGGKARRRHRADRAGIAALRAGRRNLQGRSTPRRSTSGRRRLSQGGRRLASVADHRLHSGRRRAAAQRCRIPALAVEAHRHQSRGPRRTGFPDLGTAHFELRLRPDDGYRLQLGRPDHRRQPNLSVQSNIRKGVIWSNTQQYSNPQGRRDRCRRLRRRTSPDKRKALYSEFQKIVVTDVPIYFINEVPYRNVFSKGLAGLPTTIWGVMSPLDELYWATPPKT